MPFERRARWQLSRLQGLLRLLLLFGALRVAADAAAVSDVPSMCSGVVCPAERCNKHFAYQHPCCGDQHICKCLDPQTRTFHAYESSWLTSDCRSSCKCVKALDRTTFKYKLTSRCSRLRCPASKDGCSEGWAQCCHVCKPPPPSGCRSSELGRIFANGESWKVTPCRECTCIFGREVCTNLECAPLSCPPHLTPKALPGECCPSFCRNSLDAISPHQSCREHLGNRTIPHLSSYRPRWPCSPETCVCRHGGWECDERTAVCPKKCFENRNVTLGSPGQCCLLCAGKMSCHVGDGQYRSAGHVWIDYSKRLQCACIHGVVECLTVPASLLTTSPPTPAQFAPTPRVPSWLPILLVILAVLILFFIFATAFLLRDRCDSHFSALFHPAAAAHGAAGKGTLAMHYTKSGETEIMMSDVDENANQWTEAALCA